MALAAINLLSKQKSKIRNKQIMAISLSKGQNVNLSKVSPSSKKFLIGLGWDLRATDGADFDLDASAFAQGADGKVTSDDDFVFYGAKEHPSKAIIHNGDNRTGAGSGDDESILIDVSLLPAAITKVAITCTIFEAQARSQNFGMVSNAYIRIVDADTNTEIARYDLSEDYSVETALIFGELYLHNNEWKFKAVGQGFAGGLADLCANYGITVA
jgi:tellurium resistance protein TerD